MTFASPLRLASCVLLIPLLGTQARADILPEAHAGVSHTFEIQGLEEAPPGLTFVLFPAAPGAPILRVEPGETFSCYKLFSPRLFALRGEIPALEDASSDLLESSDAPRSEVQFEQVSSVPDWLATRMVHTVYAFRGIEGRRILLDLVSETRYDADGNEVSSDTLSGSVMLLVYAGIGLILLLLFFLFMRRRRARSA